MANVFLAWNNRVDSGVLSGGTWLASLPLANLQDRQVQKVARSNGVTTAATQLKLDLQTARAIDVIGLVVHNMSASATIRFTGSADNFATTAYTSGWLNVWPSGVVPAYLLEWEDDNFWYGTLSQEMRAGYQSPCIHKLPTTQLLRYWKVEINDTANPAGYVQLGRMFLAKGWAPQVNMSYGAGIGYEDPTVVETSLTGAEYFDVRSKYRVHNFQFNYLTPGEAYGYLLDMQRLVGSSGEVLVLADPDDATTFVQRSFIGRMRKMSPLPQTFQNVFSNAIELKELI